MADTVQHRGNPQAGACLPPPDRHTPSASTSCILPATGTISDTLRVEFDPNAYATSSHSGAQELLNAITRSAVKTEAAQDVLHTTTGKYGEMLVANEQLKLDKDHHLLKRDNSKGTWTKVEGTAVLYCDELGIVRDSKGRELGRFGIDSKLAPELRQKEFTDDSHQGVFLAFRDPLAGCTFYPKHNSGTTPTPQLFNPADRKLGGQSAVVVIGMPPGIDPSQLAYEKSNEIANINHVVRGKDGPQGSLRNDHVGREHHFEPTVDSKPLEARLKDLSSALTRTADQMRTADEQRDSNGKVTKPDEQRWEYLEVRDPATGAVRRQAFGVTSNGKLLTYVGSSGTQAERTTQNGWRNVKESGTDHYFIRKDFTIVDREGKVMGSVNPLELKKEDLAFKKNADGSSSGMFLKRDISIKMNDGTVVQYGASTFALGDKKAVLQFGTPPEPKKPLEPLMKIEDLAKSESAILFAVTGDGGLVIDPKAPLVGSTDRVRHYLSSGGAVRITIDESRVDRKHLLEINEGLDKLIKANNKAKEEKRTLSREQLDQAKKLSNELDNELAKFEVHVERRAHLFSRAYNSFTREPDRQAVWREEPGVKLTYSELKEHFPEMAEDKAGPSPKRKDPPSGDIF